MIQATVVHGAQAVLVFDRTKPDGMPRKRLDVSKLRRHKDELSDGIQTTYAWCLANCEGPQKLVRRPNMTIMSYYVM